MTDVAHAINEYKRRKDLGKAQLTPSEYSVFKVKGSTHTEQAGKRSRVNVL